jgi:hypothetical protein
MKNLNAAAERKTLHSTYIPNLQQLSDSELVAALRENVEPKAIDTVNWSDYPYRPLVNFRFAHSDKALAVMFEVEEEHLRAVTLNDNGPVWEDSCVEFFVGNPNGEGYFNFEINCVGTILASYHKTRADSKPFTDEQLAKVRRFGTFKHEAIDIKGQTKWWLAEVIPFELIGLDKAPKSLKANFYKCGDKLDKAHYMSWSPITLEKPNFHCPEFFGDVELL